MNEPPRRGRPRATDIPTDLRDCVHHRRICEHRQWRRGVAKSGAVRLVWICAEWQNETNKASYARRTAEGAS